MKKIELSVPEFESLTKPGYYEKLMALIAHLSKEGKVGIETDRDMAGKEYILFRPPSQAQMLLSLADQGDYPKLDEKLGLGGIDLKSTETVDRLSKMADELSKKGKSELAAAVNDVLKLGAGRPKAPLKKLDEDVKKDLMRFLTTIKKNMKDSMDALQELFRRLRYFDIDDMVGQLELDKTLKDMEKTHFAMDQATKAMYALTYGKRPSKEDMDQMAEDFGVAGKDPINPLDFFKSQQGRLSGNLGDFETAEELPEDDEVVEDDETTELEEDMDEAGAFEDDTNDVADEELDAFWFKEEE